jgi:hypothetical protein
MVARIALFGNLCIAMTLKCIVSRRGGRESALGDVWDDQLWSGGRLCCVRQRKHSRIEKSQSWLASLKRERKNHDNYVARRVCVCVSASQRSATVLNKRPNAKRSTIKKFYNIYPVYPLGRFYPFSPLHCGSPLRASRAQLEHNHVIKYLVIIILDHTKGSVGRAEIQPARFFRKARQHQQQARLRYVSRQCFFPYLYCK